MTDLADEMGVIQSLVERFERQRLPRLLELKKRVDLGEVLSGLDIAFLEQVIHDAQQSKPLMGRHPEWRDFCCTVVHLYEHITEKALGQRRQAALAPDALLVSRWRVRALNPNGWCSHVGGGPVRHAAGGAGRAPDV